MLSSLLVSIYHCQLGSRSVVDECVFVRVCVWCWLVGGRESERNTAARESGKGKM